MQKKKKKKKKEKKHISKIPQFFWQIYSKKTKEKKIINFEGKIYFIIHVIAIFQNYPPNWIFVTAKGFVM